eukprot:4501201-Prymnesium_polylepis.1
MMTSLLGALRILTTTLSWRPFAARALVTRSAPPLVARSAVPTRLRLDPCYESCRYGHLRAGLRFDGRHDEAD